MADIKTDRKSVAKLIYKVLTEHLVVREALLAFPADCGDKTIKAAYHALVHYEADEDLRRRDSLYKEEQDDYLEFIAQTLTKGDELPENIIRNYNKYYKDTNISHKKGWKGLLKGLCKFLNV